MSQLSTCFTQNQFCVLVEYLCSMKEILPVKTQFSGFPALMTLADRVHADDDLAPIIAAQAYPKHVEKVLHFAGKGRDISDFEQFFK